MESYTSIRTIIKSPEKSFNLFMRLKTFNYVFVILCCNLISCQTHVKQPTGSKEISQITLIFMSTPSPWRVYPDNGGYVKTQAAIDYIDDNFISRHFVPDTLQNDTLRVKTNRKWFEFRHSYNGFDKLSYIFRNGDTVLFTYSDKKPIVSVLNRKTKVNEVNFDLFKKEALYPNDYPTFIKIQSFFFMKYNLNVSTEISLKKYLLEFNNENHYLDSLKQNQLISDTIYNFYKTQSIYQYKTAHLKSSLGRNTNKLKVQNLTKEDFNLPLSYDKELGQIDYGNILDPGNDNLMYFGFYNDVINMFYFNLSKKVGRIETTLFINRIADAGGSHPDYLSLYDSISGCNFLSPQVIKLFKFRTIHGIFEYNTIDEAEEAFGKFKNEVKDTALINFVKEKYSISNSKEVNDLQLVTNDSEHLTFNQLLGKHNGKVIYIDFWNSGCPPCIKEFEFSRKLMNEYKGKDFVQVFISFEPNKAKWSKASNNYLLDSESYFVENRYTSRQLEKMNIKFVPHYVIFRKNGTQIKETARPGEKGIYKLIDKYLGE